MVTECVNDLSIHTGFHKGEIFSGVVVLYHSADRLSMAGKKVGAAEG